MGASLQPLGGGVCMMHGMGVCVCVFVCVWGGMLLGGSPPHISAITDCGQTAVSAAEATGTACAAPVTREHAAGPWMAQSAVPAAKRRSFPEAEQAEPLPPDTISI